jgi:hypothetical protein
MTSSPFGAYLLLFGCISLLIGGFVAWSSGGMVDSDLTDAAIRLFIGGLVVIVGILLLLFGFISTMRRHSYAYY